jgi:hypothetical protein
MSSGTRRRLDVVCLPEPAGGNPSPLGRGRAAPVAWVVVLAGDAEIATWPILVERCGLAVVDDLARLALAVQRAGASIELRGTNTELSELIELAGLIELLGLPPADA